MKSLKRIFVILKNNRKLRSMNYSGNKFIPLSPRFDFDEFFKQFIINTIKSYYNIKRSGKPKNCFLFIIFFLLFFSISVSQNNGLIIKRVLPDKGFISKLRQPSIGNFLNKSSALEDTKLFYVINFKLQKYDTVLAVLKSVTEHAKIWVDTLSLQQNYVTGTEINELSSYIESITYQASKDNSKGIFPLVSTYFGKPPNVDEFRIKERGDGRTNILITDIKDSLSESGKYIPGFFNYEDVDKAGVVSNKMDLIYIDSYPGIYYKGTRDIKKVLTTVAHEYQHLIHWNYDPNESTFINESMSFLSEIFCGFRVDLPEAYFSNTNISLFDWNDANTDQNESRAAIFGEYLREQCGDYFIKYLVTNPYCNESGIDSALVMAGIKNETFEKLFTNWSIANYMNDKLLDTKFGYNYKFLNKPIPIQTHQNPNVLSNMISINNLAPAYIKYTMAESLSAVFHYNNNIIVKALEIGNSSFNTYDVSANNYYVQNDFGSIYKEIVFMCINLNKNTSTKEYINYSSTGKKASNFAEIAYDDGEPEVFGLSGEVGLKRFVRFRIPAGKQLDSVRFGFKTQGKALFHIYKATDTSIFAVDNIISPLMITVSDTFPAWTNVNLTQFKIIPDYDIAAGYELLPSDAPNPGIWGDNTAIQDRSIIYFPSTVSWHSINTNYLIRVYLSDFIVKVDKINDLIPDNFKLYQNYPNPFNGTTTINFDLNKAQTVKLKIYDLLGKEVITLADGHFDSGSYSIKWYGKNKYAVNVPSGLYIYCLENSDKQVFKKMVYLK